MPEKIILPPWSRGTPVSDKRPDIEKRRGTPLSEEEYAVRAEGMKAKLYRTAFLYLGSETAAVDAVDEAVY